MMLNKNLQEINIQNMDTELVAQMFKNYQSNVLFHLEGSVLHSSTIEDLLLTRNSHEWIEGSCLIMISGSVPWELMYAIIRM